MIGLIDCDMIHRGNKFFPNLDLMKLYSYYKTKNFPKLLRPSDDVNDYEKIFLWKDIKESEIEDKFWEHPNIITGGLYFTNGIYKPFSNIDIENSSPSYRLYNEFFRLRLNNQISKRLNSNILQYLSAGFIRINTPGKLQTNQLKKDGNLYVYDTDIFDRKYIDILEDFSNYVKNIYFCYSLFAKTRTDFDIIMNSNFYVGSNNEKSNSRLIIDFKIPINGWLVFLKEYKDLLDNIAVKSIALNGTVDYSMCSFHTKKWYSDFTKDIINKWLIAYVNGIDLSIYYKKDSKNPYDSVLQKFSAFSSYLYRDYSFFELCKRNSEIFKSLKELYNFDTIYYRYLHLSGRTLKEDYYDKSKNPRRYSRARKKDKFK